MKTIILTILFLLCPVPLEMGANVIKIDKVAMECSVVTEQINDSVRLYAEKTKATYYADKFHGRKTASGKIFSQHKLTVAHNSLPFGTTLKITNLKNNKSVIVVVTDRGKLGKNVTLDLSKEAFKKIANTDKGIINVKVEILEETNL